MAILQFPTDPDKSPFFKDIIEDGFHVFSLKNAKKENFYPNTFPDYPGVKLKKLKIGDTITVRIFFRVGSGNDVRADGGYIDLEVEHIEAESITAVILTELPKEFTLGKGYSLEIFEEDILYKKTVTDH